MSPTSQKSPEPARFGGVARPHVVHVVGTLGAGGVQRLVLGLATSKALSGYRHSVLCMLGATGNLRSHFERLPMRIESCSVKWPSIFPIGSYTVSEWLRQRLSFTFPGRLAELLRQMEADLVHTHLSVDMSRQANGVVRRARLPWVWTIHSDHRPEGGQLEDWLLASRLASAGNARITAVADEIVRDLRSRGFSRVETSRGGIDLSRFLVASTKDPQWRERLGIPAGAVVVGAAGRLTGLKAYDVLLDAAAGITDAPALHVVLAGGGPERKPLEAQARRLGIQDRVHLLGFLDDVPRFLHQLDVFVIPSRLEGFPIALLEALASGLPCIASPVGGVLEMLGEKGGILVTPESVDELAEALRRVRSPEVRQAYASGGAAISRNFSLDRMAEQFAEIYENLWSADQAGAPSQRKVSEQ